MKLKEADIKRQICDVLNIPAKQGRLWYFKPLGGLGQRAGIPDIIGCHDGCFFGIEVKRPGGKLSAKQQQELHAITESGGLAFIADNPEIVVEKLGLGYRIYPLWERQSR